MQWNKYWTASIHDEHLVNLAARLCSILYHYHTSNSCECMGVNGEALQLHAVYKKLYFLLQLTRESVSVLQVTWESVSGTASHARCVWTCKEIEGSYDKIIITIVPSYTGKNITRLLPLALLLVLRTRNNTDGNKLVIFSGIALVYGDNYIIAI